MIVVGIIIAAICGLLVGQDAAKRGMSPWGWGLFVFLICIIGLPMYVIMRQPVQASGDTVQAPHDPQVWPSVRKCPFCAEAIQEAAIKCRYCGEMLTAVSSESRVPPAAPPVLTNLATEPAKPDTRFKFCSSCGSRSWLADAYCWKCKSTVFVGEAGLAPSAAPPVIGVASSPVEGRKCPYCGAPLAEHLKWCPSCKRDFSNSTRPDRTLHTKLGFARGLRIYVAGFALVVGTGLMYAGPIERGLPGLGILVTCTAAVAVMTGSLLVRIVIGLVVMFVLFIPAAVIEGTRESRAMSRTPPTGATQAESSAPISATEPSPSGVTLENYERLTDGISYSQAIEILGAPGTELSRSSLGGITTVMYQWKASGLAGLGGGNMNAMFQDGRLVTKAQFGLR